MPRYIDADALKRKAQKTATEAWKMKLTAKVETTLNQFIDWIDGMPTVQPKTGKWITDNPSNPYESDYCKCSVCGYTNCTVEVLAFDGYSYCPNCGAKMLKEGDGRD